MRRFDHSTEYRRHLTLFLESRETLLSRQMRKHLLAALLSERGALIFTGQSDAIGPDEESAVAQLTADDLELALENLDADKLRERLEGFLSLSNENAGDVALAEDENERDAAGDEGRSLLRDRHEFECQVAALRWIAAKRPDLKEELDTRLDHVEKSLLSLDEIWRQNIGHFVTLNGYRRTLRDQYPDPNRFWWWHQLSECDLEALYDVVEGRAEAAEHLKHCLSCSDLLAKLMTVSGGLRAYGGLRGRHPATEDVIRFYYGETEPHEDESIEAHVVWCADCRWELEALNRADMAEPVPPLSAAGQDGAVPIGEGRPDLPSERPAGPGRWLIHTEHVFPTERLGVAADTAIEVEGLPGNPIYRDEEIEAWVDGRGERVRVRVYGKNLSELGSLEVVDSETAEPVAISTVAATPEKREFDVGSTRELAGRSLQLAIEHKGRRIRLPRIDLAVKHGK